MGAAARTSATFLALIGSTGALQVANPSLASGGLNAVLSRRTAVQAAGAAAAAALGMGAASAEEPFTRMGGLLEPFIDVNKGYKLYRPAGWNEFPADPGVYDIKFQDIIEPETTVQVSTSPVSTATSIDALGDLECAPSRSNRELTIPKFLIAGRSPADS